MARKKGKQQQAAAGGGGGGSGGLQQVQKELMMAAGQQPIINNNNSPVSPVPGGPDAPGGTGGSTGGGAAGDATAAAAALGGLLERPASTRANNQQRGHTCCLLCHREFKDWGQGSGNCLPAGHCSPQALSQALMREVPGRKLADAVPSLSQSLLGEVPLWICQSCRKSVEEEERRTTQEQATAVPLSHSSSCKSQSCGNGYPEQSSVDWDPSSFLSAHKLSGLWNSAHTNGGVHCNHAAAAHSQQGVTGGSSACHDKRGSHEAPGKSAKPPGTKVCPYSHPSSQNTTTAGNPLSTSADLCKTTPKHFKTMCRRPTPPGEAFHPSDHHQHSDLSVPPNSPTGLSSSQHSSSSSSSSLLPPKQSLGGHQQHHGHAHAHAPSPTSPGCGGVAPAHAPFPPLAAPNLLHASSTPPAAAANKLSTTTSSSCGPDSPTSLHKPGPPTCKNSHIPAVNAQHSKLGSSLMGGCNHPCNGHNGGGGGGAVASSNVGHLPPGACRDQACKGHKVSNGTLCHAPSELEEGEDEDSSSERSSCASSSTNQKDGKYCDCCYCEFFGHNAPPAAPTSRNYAEIREKLRTRLTRRKEEAPAGRQDPDLLAVASSSAIDNRDVDELLDFINSSEPKPVNSAKAAKRARHKQKKKEKAQQCPEAAGYDGDDDPHSTTPPLDDEPLDDDETVPTDSTGPGSGSGSGSGSSEASRLLDWPQLELERVNSFLTSRLEEIKNTIKDSIRASFSMYDLNLDVNDFPKKAATLEANHLLSHLNNNGSSDLQHIDLDLAPLATFKSHLDLVNGWEAAHPPNISPQHLPSSTTTTTVGGAVTTAGPKEVQRLHTTPSLSKLIRVRSPERCTSSTGPDGVPPPPAPAPPAQAPARPPKEDTTTTTVPLTPDPKNNSPAPPPANAAKSKKSKKQQQRQDQQPPAAPPPSEQQQNPTKPAKAAPPPGGDAQKTTMTHESRATETPPNASNASKTGHKSQQAAQQQQHSTDNVQRTERPKKPDEGQRSSRQAAHNNNNNGTNGGSLSNNAQGRGKGGDAGETPTRGGGRSEPDSDGRANPGGGAPANGQPKGKNKKNKNKGEKSTAIDDVFLPKEGDPTEMDEIDREVEYFKRFCLDSAKQTRQKVAVNWSNFSLKKVPSNSAQ